VIWSGFLETDRAASTLKATGIDLKLARSTAQGGTAIMKNAGAHRLLLPVILAVVFALPQPMAGQSGGSYDLYKEVIAGKNKIVWRKAPANAIPDDVCALLQVCGGETKLIALPPATEGGQKIGRGMFLTETRGAKHSDAVLLERQTIGEIYFLQLSPSGGLQKAAYRELGKQWVVIANSLARPTYNKERQIWHEHLVKIGVVKG
jgi:hypothetical protein